MISSLAAEKAKKHWQSGPDVFQKKHRFHAFSGISICKPEDFSRIESIEYSIDSLKRLVIFVYAVEQKNPATNVISISKQYIIFFFILWLPAYLKMVDKRVCFIIQLHHGITIAGFEKEQDFPNIFIAAYIAALLT